MTYLSNTAYDDIEIGQSADYQKTVTEQDIQLFALVSGDSNPMHLDEDYAKSTDFGGRIAHGMLIGAHVSGALGTTLPGPGTVFVNQSLKFKHPVRINDTLTTTLTVSKKRDGKRLVSLDCKVTNQDGKLVALGDAMVIAPAEKCQIRAAKLPKVSLE